MSEQKAYLAKAIRGIENELRHALDRAARQLIRELAEEIEHHRPKVRRIHRCPGCDHCAGFAPTMEHHLIERYCATCSLITGTAVDWPCAHAPEGSS